MHLLLIAALISIAPVDTGGPNRQPQMAASKDMTVLVFGNQGSVWFSKSLDGVKTFSKPVRVGGGAALALGRHRGPRVVLSGNAIVVSAVLGHALATGPHAHGLPEDGDLLAWRSTDGGEHWTEPVIINDVPAAPREGLHAMAVAADGTIAAAWLDLREKGTRLFGSYSKDGGATWSKNVQLYTAPGGTICQCCDPSLAVDHGKFAVMFRNVVVESRDLYIARWDTRTQVVEKPDKVGVGTWTINACPMDGGGLASRDGILTTAWRRGESVFVDRIGAPEREIGQGKDVALAAARNGDYISWTAAGGIELLSPGQTLAQPIGKGGAFSSLVALPTGGVAVAWESDGSIQLEVAKPAA